MHVIARHGQTNHNAQRIHQAEEISISAKGRDQSKLLGHALSQDGIGQIFTSDAPRAIETAINAQGALPGLPPISPRPQLREWRSPSCIRGLHYDDPRAIAVKDELRNHYHETGWQHSDEETFVVFKKRGQAVLELLQRQEMPTLVITHGRLITLLLALMQAPELSSYEYSRLRPTLYPYNAAFARVEYVRGWWRVLAANVHSHLPQDLKPQ